MNIHKQLEIYVAMINEQSVYNDLQIATRIRVDETEMLVLNYLFSHRDVFPYDIKDTNAGYFILDKDKKNIAYLILNYYREEFGSKMSAGLHTGLDKRFPTTSGKENFQHYNSMTGDYSCDEPTKQSYEEYEMDKTTATQQTVPPVFETKHFVHGTEIPSLSDDQLVNAIAEQEKQIKRLSKINHTSKKIKKMIKQCFKDISSIVKQLDKRA